MRLRKRVGEQEAQPEEPRWLPLEELAEVSVSSEDASAPVKAALVQGSGGWRAATAGPQSLRIHFDHPQDVELIHARSRFKGRDFRFLHDEFQGAHSCEA